jgi:hypothetical protein
VKRAVKAVWDPRAALAKRDPDMTIFVTKGRRIALDVTIDSSGWLKTVSVKESSSAAEAIVAHLVNFTGTSTISGNDTTATCPP